MVGFEARATELLKDIAGSGAEFRPGQLEAIRSLVVDRNRVLVVQRTGWGKSAVYLIAAKMLREERQGPTVIVSPLLALMRNQLAMAKALETRSGTINSSNTDEWRSIIDRTLKGEIDLLLISPERLANEQFRSEVLPALLTSFGLLVIDEAHCISDWGHDFRPDYRRLARLVNLLPPTVPILGTTATANSRVEKDVSTQLGADLLVLRGSLDRPSLRLQVTRMADRAGRMAWIAQHMGDLPQSGIVYCLTVKDAERVGAWLRSKDLTVAVYHGRKPTEEREHIEEQLSQGMLKAVVATSALGMGYDNPHIGFVVHFQMPGSPVAYYQQVGRAGRALQESIGVLLVGKEDRDIQDYFIETAFPEEAKSLQVLQILAESSGLSVSQIESRVNARHSQIQKMLKILEVQGAVYRDMGKYFRSAERWEYPRDEIEAITQSRRREQAAMAHYATASSCLMQQLRAELDDPAGPCGRCQVCEGREIVPSTAERGLCAEVWGFLRKRYIPIEPRTRWPSGLEQPEPLRRMEEGRSLTYWGDPGLGARVKPGKYEEGRFGMELVAAMAEMIVDWRPEPSPEWVTSVPSRSRPELVSAFAQEVAKSLDLPYLEAVEPTGEALSQKSMENSFQKARNALAAYRVEAVKPGPVFLIDDVVDSRWTLAVIADRLQLHGSGPVYPVALADASAD